VGELEGRNWKGEVWQETLFIRRDEANV